ncbi:hypothetical protein RV15_GL002328 [Enterococcus silesiacus]|uniref:Uncharacterized protein n=1 Tax=Enterococcus silesiacus TaxID=332949 RepID=A0AA91GHW4_9ENTE|nr:hypothetical protein RV15_GL002328 [Enterococcus silesiacus]
MLFLVDKGKNVLYYIFIPTTTFLFFILLLLSNTPFPSAFSAGGFLFFIIEDCYYLDYIFYKIVSHRLLGYFIN